MKSEARGPAPVPCHCVEVKPCLNSSVTGRELPPSSSSGSEQVLMWPEVHPAPDLLGLPLHALGERCWQALSTGAGMGDCPSRQWAHPSSRGDSPVTQLCPLPPLACLPLRFNRCSFPGNTGGEAGVRVRPCLQGQPRLFSRQPAASPDALMSRSSKPWHRPQQLRAGGVGSWGGQAHPGSEEDQGATGQQGDGQPGLRGGGARGRGSCFRRGSAPSAPAHAPPSLVALV